MQAWSSAPVPVVPGRGPELRLYDTSDRQVRPVAAAFIQRELESLRATLDAAPALPFPDPAPLDDFFRRVVTGNGD